MRADWQILRRFVPEQAGVPKSGGLRVSLIQRKAGLRTAKSEFQEATRFFPELVVSMLEGGYNLRGLASAAVSHAAVLVA